VNPAAPVAVLRALSPAAPDGNLADVDRAAAVRCDPGAFAACRRLTAHPGQAAARTKAVLYDLLCRPAPGPHPPPGAAGAISAHSGPVRKALSPGSAPTAYPANATACSIAASGSPVAA
jgi:hypothetical protein